MKTVELTKTPPAFQEAVRMARDEIVVLTEDGEPAFALIGVKDALALEALSLSRNAEFMAYLDEIGEQARTGPTLSLNEIREEYKSSARKVRRSNRAKSR